MTSNLKFKFGRGLALVIVLNLLGGLATGATVALIREELFSLSREYRERRDLAERLANANAIAEAHAANLEASKLLGRHFLGRDALPDVIEGIEGLARLSGVEFAFSNFDDESAAGNLQIAIKAQGQWSQLIRFAELLANAPWSMRFGDVNLQEDRAGLWTAQFDLTVLSYEPELTTPWSIE